MGKKYKSRKLIQKEEPSYKEKLQHGQGLDLDPKSVKEIKSTKSKNYLANESDYEAALNGGKNSQYFTEKGHLGSEKGHLGSLPLHDDYSEESEV